MASRTARNTPSAAAQRGQAMMIGVVIIFLGIAAIVYTTATSGIAALANRQADETTRAMAQVKEALIGWSAARTPVVGSENRRPGELPCPDNDNTGTDSGSCSAGAIGRVPWRSLGIPEPKDSSGETLWYAIAGPFRNYGMSTAPITSNTQGNLTVYLDSSSATMTSQAIAVIFAPGAALGTQDRGTTVAACSTTGTSIAGNLCGANYLEATGGGNNAQTGGPFIQAQKSSSFNDRVLAITNTDLMPVVEQRVAREMISLLNQYRAATATSALYPGGVYPWADLSDGNSNAVPLLGAYNRNRFPCGTASPTAWGAVPTGGTTATPVLPNWLKDVAALGDTKCSSLTGWNNVVYYAVSRSILELTGITCTTCTAASLSITNPSSAVGTQCTTASAPVCTPTIITAGTANMLLIMSGGYTGSPARSWPSASFAAITGYFEDGENSDNDDDTYTVPTATLYNRDRIFIVR
jgi:hypothetical protein